jgi:hypothetical protein
VPLPGGTLPFQMKKLIPILLLFSCSKSPQQAANESITAQGNAGKIPSHQLFAWGAITGENLRGISKKDSDKDGIIDYYDQCPKQKETVNGYQDGDGCPDTAPPPPPTDTVVTPPKDTVVVPPPPASFPSTYRLTMPPVINQGSEGSCLPMTVGYYSLSAEIYYKTGASSYSYSTNIFSPEYLYNNLTLQQAGCSGGTAMIENYNYLINNGIVLYSEAPYMWDNGCNDIVSDAPKQKISSYQTILPSDISAMKQAIYDKHPLGFVFTADKTWYYGDGSANFVWKGPYVSTEIYGGHGCTVVGWDDAKQAWLTINSFGTTWGDAGYRWISYDWFSYITTRAYKIIL